MGRNRNPGEGQMDGFPEMEPPAPSPEESTARFNAEQRRAFGSVPKLLGVELNPAIELTEEDERRVDVSSLHKGLYTTWREGRRVVNGLGLNKKEYTAIPRSISHLETHVSAVAGAAHEGLSNEIRTAEVEQTSPIHVLERFQAEMPEVIKGLDAEKEQLARLRSYIRTPGFARTTQADLVVLANNVLQISFTNMLRVSAHNLDWSMKEKEAAAQAMQQRLFRGPQRSRVQYWGELSGLALQYTNHKRLLFIQRLHEVDSRLIKAKKEYDSFRDEVGI
jgi:hypothetical protein